MDIHITIPKAWNELTPKQFLGVSRMFQKGYSNEELLTQVLMMVCGWQLVPWRIIQKPDEKLFLIKKKNQQFWISADQIQAAASQLHWIIESFELPSTTPRIRGFRIPDLRIYNTTLEQFLMAENYMAGYFATKKEVYLNSMIAVFYLRKGEIFDSNRVAKHANRFRWIARYRKQAVLFWFAGVKSWLANKYGYVFTKSDDSSMPSDTMIMNLLSNLNGGDVTKNERILKTHVHEAFHELNLLMEQQKSGKNVRTV